MSYVHADVENLKATELRLGLPGAEETDKMPTPPSTPRAGSKRALAGDYREEEPKTAPPAAKAQVVGWPPVRSYRKSCFQQQEQGSCAIAGEEAGGGRRRRCHRGGPRCGRQRRITVREGEHGWSPLPAEDRPQDVQGLPRAQGGPGSHVPRLLWRGRHRQHEPLGLRRDLRGQGRRPHARRRRALRDVLEHLQEDEDHEGIRSKRPCIIKGVKQNLWRICNKPWMQDSSGALEVQVPLDKFTQTSGLTHEFGARKCLRRTLPMDCPRQER